MEGHCCVSEESATQSTGRSHVHRTLRGASASCVLHTASVADSDAADDCYASRSLRTRRPTCEENSQRACSASDRASRRGHIPGGDRLRWSRRRGSWRDEQQEPFAAARLARRAPGARSHTIHSLPALLTVLLASLFFTIMPATVHGAIFAAIGKVVGGDSGTHRLTITTDDAGAELLQVLKDVGDANEMMRGRDPSVGVASWNSVEKFYYYAAAEDGFASAYVTPYSYVSNQSKTQRIVRGQTAASFTLTSIQYNRIDGFIYGLITYSSGEHFMVKVLADTRDGAIREELTFDALLQLDYTHVVPGLAALDAIEQIYYGIGVKTITRNGKSFQQGYLFALKTGMAAIGVPDPASHLWNRELPGVLTSLQVDPTSGNLYGMLHNVSGHFLLHFDPQNKGKFGGQYKYLIPGELTYMKPDPSDLFTLSADTEVIFGLSSFSPPSGAGRAAEADYFSMVYENYVDENGTMVEVYNILLQNLGDAENNRVDPNTTSEQFVVNDEEGYTMTSMQVMYTTIPQIEQLVPSTAHIVGGLQVTVIGQPFVDTGPTMIKCRWRLFLSGTTTFGSEILYSTAAYFKNSSTCVCQTPVVFTRIKGMLDLTLTGGAIWTHNAKPFTFFETTLRAPLTGSSKGRSVVQIKGLYLDSIPLSDVDYTTERGKPGVIRDKLNEAQCEFGAASEDYAFDDQAVSTGDVLFQVQGNAPVGPIFRRAQCENITVGLTMEEVCVITCLSPPVPSEKCDENSQLKCSHFFKKCPEEFDKAVTPCKSLLRPFETIPFAFTFYGQRIPLGTWSFNGHSSPFVEGAKFTQDGTGIIIQFDLDTNKGQEVGGRLEARKLILDSGKLFGRAAYFTYILRDRILVTFGYQAEGTEDSFFDIRPASLGARYNWYRFATGVFVLDGVPDNKKQRPVAHVVAPANTAQCTRLKVSASASSHSGGRPVDHMWGVRASKCIDLMCLNSVAMNEKQQVWLLPAQRSLYQTKSVDFDAEDALSGSLNSLAVLSVNRFNWFLQTANFYYKDYIEDPQRLIPGHCWRRLPPNPHSLLRSCLPRWVRAARGLTKCSGRILSHNRSKVVLGQHAPLGMSGATGLTPASPIALCSCV